MSSVLEIEQAIRELPPEQLGQFRKWLEDYELEQDSLAASLALPQLFKANNIPSLRPELTK